MQFSQFEQPIEAACSRQREIEQDDLEEARDKVRFGRAKKSRVIDEKDKIATAYHESGHAVIQYLERPTSDPIHKVTIIPRGRYGGVTMTLPEKDRSNYSRKWAIAFIKMGLAGRIAEEMFTGDVNTGAGGDQAFHLVDQFSGQAGVITMAFGGRSHTTVIKGDVDGDGHADFAVRIDDDVRNFIDLVL